MQCMMLKFYVNFNPLMPGRNKGSHVVGLFKGALSHLGQFLATESPLKMMKNAFLFHLKSSARSQGISILVLTFWSCRKTT